MSSPSVAIYPDTWQVVTASWVNSICFIIETRCNTTVYKRNESMLCLMCATWASCTKTAWICIISKVRVLTGHHIYPAVSKLIIKCLMR